MRILVTGANGFVGNEVVRQLLPDHDVLALDVLRYGPWRLEEEESPRLQLVALDLTHRGPLQEVITGFEPEAIIHLAAIHFIPECEASPDEAVANNVQATVNIASLAPKGCRFVFASTAAVYAPSDQPHVETGALAPMDVYGLTKLAGEDLVRYYAKHRDLSAVILRMFNVVGPGETNPHLVPDIIKQLRVGQRVLSLGNTTPQRDYIFVRDAAAGFIAAATASVNATREVLTANLGTGVQHSVTDIVSALSKIIDEHVLIVSDPDRMRASDRPFLCAERSRMKEYFGWEPQCGLEEALTVTWEQPRMLAKLL